MNKLRFANTVLIAAIGILTAIAPENFIKVTVMLIGAVSFITGFYNIFAVRKLLALPKFRSMVLVRGLICIFCGAFAVMFPIFAAKIAWTAFLYAMAIYLAVISLMQIYAIVKLRANSISVKGFAGEILISIILSVVFFTVPSKVGFALVRSCGAILAAIAILFAVFQAKGLKSASENED